MPALSKLVFITGASSGIGQALALRFYQAGYRLALVARRDSVMKKWASASQLSADRCQIYTADVSDTEAIIAAANACIRDQGLPDVVIANAGISIGIDTACHEDINTMARVFATNNLGMMATFHPFVQAMTERARGTLVGIGSVAGIRGLPGHGAYSASKAAAITYCESLRGEMRPWGVKVVTICPGYIDTPLTRQNRYTMPFLMTAEDFATQAFKAIEAQTSYKVIPWQMGWLSKLLRLLPNSLYDKAMAGRPRKHRQIESTQQITDRHVDHKH
jgi:short-subunit dehydrogenase